MSDQKTVFSLAMSASRCQNCKRRIFPISLNHAAAASPTQLLHPLKKAKEDQPAGALVHPKDFDKNIRVMYYRLENDDKVWLLCFNKSALGAIMVPTVVFAKKHDKKLAMDRMNLG